MAGPLAMLGSLLWFQLSVFCRGVLLSIAQAGRWLWAKRETHDASHAMYEGVVWHERKHPVRHQFEYKVRYALVNLDESPAWFAAASRHHLSAQQARSIVGTSGAVYLLCMPASVGYEQNPLSVYYCYDDAGLLARAIAEVTNTPWGERVTFDFDPSGDCVAKPLHVSPFMDMEGSWLLHATCPGEKLALTIRVDHPQFGNFFMATLRAKKISVQNPEFFSWLMPHKVALWIYWQALVLLWKGVSFIQHPKYVDGDAYRERATIRDQVMKGGCPMSEGSDGRARREQMAAGTCRESSGASAESRRHCTWREAAGQPWL
ncbi:uncharacterized protein MPTK1_7g09610 [Marchantia polymorpha subsp. ruderalis]|uniref:DUF1365 domain-containing protein n=2 Tax=Marchantia polymorpha TaxID=3197 RepID=A0AAF6BXU0_MARPO|nr:hypothetical protein MARPO_0156s0023 [Marchantia polymorpha]BBN16824.1 hypothetical protein Mp_7g09610 [Marchantia polymorpha subsp. ruderalis]|eukprot:PTQ28726.1 hypothetical protein MARPO_0156s0023 [Marchantia polymorpha]